MCVGALVPEVPSTFLQLPEMQSHVMNVKTLLGKWLICLLYCAESFTEDNLKIFCPGMSPLYQVDDR